MNNMAKFYEYEIPDGYEARIEGNKVIIEFRESEDERIRKELIGGLMWQRDNLEAKGPHDDNLILPGFTMKVGNIIDYFRKQKEEKSEECVADSIKFDEGFKTGREVGFREGVESVKPVEWSEYDKGALKDAICATDILGNDESFNKGNPNLGKAFRVAKDWLKNFPERFNLKKCNKEMNLDDRLEEISRNGLENAHTIDFSKEYENSKQILEKGANRNEWSEEDIEKNLIAYLRYERKSTPQEIEEKFIPYIKRIKIMEQESVSPMSYGSLDEALHEAGRRFDLPYTDEDKYSFADVFYAGVRAERESKQEWSEEDERYLSQAIETLEHGNYLILADKLKSLRPQPREEIYQSAKHDFAIRFMNYLDENRTEGKMCLSNAECEDIDKAFKENDWAKILRYAEKYGKKN